MALSMGLVNDQRQHRDRKAASGRTTDFSGSTLEYVPRASATSLVLDLSETHPRGRMRQRARSCRI